jgi:hypothetical protein
MPPKPRGRAVAKTPADGGASPRTGSPAGMRSASRGPPTSTPRKERDSKDKPVELLAEQPWQARWRSFKTRTGSTVALLAMFVGILRAGHVFVCALVFAIQVCAARSPAPRARARPTGAQRARRASVPHPRAAARAAACAAGCQLHACGVPRSPRGPRADLALPQTAMVAEMYTLAAQKNVEKGLPGFRLQQWYFFFTAAFYGYGRMLKTNLLAELAENAWLPGIIRASRALRRRTALSANKGHNPTGAACGRPTAQRRARFARASTAAAGASAYAAATQLARPRRRLILR